ncbi:MAG: S24 family peptidase [Bryobacteraceae bacterium]|jgi:SOS-response transcriptional repressor LexA
MLLPRRGEYAVLGVCLPGQAEAGYGVLLRDPASDSVYQRCRRVVPGCEDQELFELLPEDLEAKAREMGGERLLALLEDALSNTLRIADRRLVLVRDFEAALARLYERYVEPVRREPVRVVPFVTHLPLYSLRAAAGRFGEDMEVEPEDWVAAPAGVRPARDLYAVHVAGRSMEPEIPDGAVAVFRSAPAGSRQGKRVLVWRRGASEAGGEFTLKVYESEKRSIEEGWEHARIRLKPLNPDYPVLELDEESDHRVLGELVGVLAIDEE